MVVARRVSGGSVARFESQASLRSRAGLQKNAADRNGRPRSRKINSGLLVLLVVGLLGGLDLAAALALARVLARAAGVAGLATALAGAAVLALAAVGAAG